MSRTVHKGDGFTMVDSKKASTEPIQKRRYDAPSLTVFGDLRAVTQAVANKGMLDGGPFALRTASTV